MIFSSGRHIAAKESFHFCEPAGMNNALGESQLIAKKQKQKQLAKRTTTAAILKHF
jgi:hypothetical protein